MSARSKNSSKALDRPFTRTVATKARTLACKYQIILSYEDKEWYGRGLELPNVFGEGRTPQQCVKSVREAFAAVVATMIEAGQVPPAPAKQGVRSAQVNIRLTPDEKALLEAKARRKGFRGLSDSIRAAALSAQ